MTQADLPSMSTGEPMRHDGHYQRRELVVVRSGVIDWGPLERLAAVVSSVDGLGVSLDADDFMWMGQGELDDATRLELYKHRDTRRYLNLDDGGHAYRYDRVGSGGYVRYDRPAEAIAWVTSAESHSAAATILERWRNPSTGPPPALPIEGPGLDF